MDGRRVFLFDFKQHFIPENMLKIVFFLAVVLTLFSDLQNIKNPFNKTFNSNMSTKWSKNFEPGFI